MSEITIRIGTTDVGATARKEKGKNIIDFPKDYVVVDIETTGLPTDYDSIIELSALKVVNNEISDTFSSLVNPRFKIDHFITELTGITNEMLKNAETIKKVLPKFIDFVGDSKIVGHNVNFDINFIYDNCVEVMNKPFRNDFIDTMRIARKILRELPHHRLSDLASYYNVSYEGAHRALTDCKITQECFKKLQETILTKFETLDDFVKHATTKKNNPINIAVRFKYI